MVYLFYGTKEFQIEKEVDVLCENIDKLNISKYDLENDLLSLVIEDALTYSLFGDKKVVVAENANLFSSSGKGSEELEEYLKKPNPNTILIFTLINDKIDSRKKIVKLIDKIGCVKCFNDELDAVSLVRFYFKGYDIDFKTVNLLIDRIGTNPLIIQNEANKIKIYKGNDLKITDEDILNLTVKRIDIDVFKLIDYIVKNDKDKALEMYYEMLKMNEEPLKIVIILANQFRLMYQAKELLKKGYMERDIASLLKVHPYRVKLAIQNSRSYSSETLLKYLNDLADIDIGIKTGVVNKDLALELFILKK